MCLLAYNTQSPTYTHALQEASMRVFTDTFTHIHTYTLVHIHTHSHTHTRTHAHLYTHIHIHIHIHIHTQIHRLKAGKGQRGRERFWLRWWAWS